MSHWGALSLYYHDDLERPLVDLVLPMVRDLKRRGDLQAWFFVRYWEGGSHLRLRLAAADQEQSMIIVDRARSRCSRYLREHPSTKAMPEEQYRRLAAVFAAAEGVAEVPDQLPDNTVRVCEYHPEHDRYGDGETLREIEDHFQTSSEIAIRLIARRATQDERMTACYGFLLAAWRIAMAEPERLGTFADVLFDAWRRRLGPRIAPEREAAFAERYEQQRARLHARAGVAVDPLTEIWRRSLRPVASVVGSAIADGSFRPQPRPGWEGLVEPSRIDVGVLSILDLCTHLLCNRLGINTVQESYLRFIAATVTRELAADSAMLHPALEEV